MSHDEPGRWSQRDDGDDGEGDDGELVIVVGGVSPSQPACRAMVVVGIAAYLQGESVGARCSTASLNRWVARVACPFSGSAWKEPARPGVASQASSSVCVASTQPPRCTKSTPQPGRRSGRLATMSLKSPYVAGREGRKGRDQSIGLYLRPHLVHGL